MELLEYLYKNINKSKNTVKNILKNGNVYVNGKKTTKYNYILKESDKVEIRNNTHNINIIYEDKDIIVVDKPYNLLTIATDKEKEKTLYHMISEYVKEKNKNSKIYIVHRLDKETSGLIVLAKSLKVKQQLQDNWNKTIRKYYAIVKGNTKDKDIIETKLIEKGNKVYQSKDGKLAITEYKKTKNNDSYSLLDINIKTGRKHQIRYQLNEVGHPIIGDMKYGNIKNKRMFLHAYYLELQLNKEVLKFEIELPKDFRKVIYENRKRSN